MKTLEIVCSELLAKTKRITEAKVRKEKFPNLNVWLVREIFFMIALIIANLVVYPQINLNFQILIMVSLIIITMMFKLFFPVFSPTDDQLNLAYQAVMEEEENTLKELITKKRAEIDYLESVVTAENKKLFSIKDDLSLLENIYFTANSSVALLGSRINYLKRNAN